MYFYLHKLFSLTVYFCVTLAQYNEYSVSTVDTDSLVVLHQGINSQGAEFALMGFHLFVG